MKTFLTNEEIEGIAEDALNALCVSVQDAIGQTDGGLAGIYFSGSHGIKDIIEDYIRTEIRFAKLNEEETA